MIVTFVFSEMENLSAEIEQESPEMFSSADVNDGVPEDIGDVPDDVADLPEARDDVPCCWADQPDDSSDPEDLPLALKHLL